MTTPIDIQIGDNIRTIRKSRGKGLEELAEAIGVSMQQAQKYERAMNRISASRLWLVARYLKTPITRFFADVKEEPDVGG